MQLLPGELLKRLLHVGLVGGLEKHLILALAVGAHRVSDPVLPRVAVEAAQALVLHVHLPHVPVLLFQLVHADLAAALDIGASSALVQLLLLAVGQIFGNGGFQQTPGELAPADDERQRPLLNILLHVPSHSFPWDCRAERPGQEVSGCGRGGRSVAAADHQHMGAPEVVAGRVDAVLVLLGDAVLEEQRQEQQRADRRETGVVDRAAILGGVLSVLVLVLAPGGGDIGQKSFHGFFLSSDSGHEKWRPVQPPS